MIYDLESQNQNFFEKIETLYKRGFKPKKIIFLQKHLLFSSLFPLKLSLPSPHHLLRPLSPPPSAAMTSNTSSLFGRHFFGLNLPLIAAPFFPSDQLSENSHISHPPLDSAKNLVASSPLGYFQPCMSPYSLLL